MECSVINILIFLFTTLFSPKKELARSQCLPYNLAFGFSILSRLILLCLGFSCCYCYCCCFEIRSFMDVQTNLGPTAVVLSPSPNIEITGTSHNARLKFVS